MSKGRLLLLGGGSDIGLAVARRYAFAGYDICLAGRNIKEIKKNADIIKIKFDVESHGALFDALDFDSHQAFYDSLDPKPDGVITAFGYPYDIEKPDGDFYECRKVIDVTYTGAVSILNIIARDFENHKSGFIVGISSVAGDRGRAKNFVYGGAKAAFTTYLSGLRARLHASSVHVMTVKPGWVATKATEKLDLPSTLVGKPEDVADDIFSAQQKGKNVIYTRWYWRIIMYFIIHMPEFIFKRMKF